MSVENCTLKANATSLTTVGGTDLTYTEDGVEVANGLHVSAASVTDFTVRPSITAKNRNPVLQSDKTWSKAKQTVTGVKPKLLANGTTVFNLYRIEVETHPESTAAEKTDLKLEAAQVLASPEFANFFSAGSLRS